MCPGKPKPDSLCSRRKMNEMTEPGEHWKVNFTSLADYKYLLIFKILSQLW